MQRATVIFTQTLEAIMNKNVKAIPDGYSTITPHLIVRRRSQGDRFLQEGVWRGRAQAGAHARRIDHARGIEDRKFHHHDGR